MTAVKQSQRNEELYKSMIRIEANLENLIKTVEAQGKLIAALDKTLRGGNGTEAGILGDVDQIKEWIAGRTWFEKIIIAAMIGQFIGLLFLVFSKGIFG